MSIPNLRFKGFNEDWKENRLEDYFTEFRSGKTITSKTIFENGSYPVYGGNGLRGYSNEYTHNGNYFLIGRQGALCGNITDVQGKCFISEHAIACKANNLNSTNFFSQKLKYINLNRLSESSAQPGLAVNKLLRLKIYAPNLIEQEKIAGFFTVIDKKLNLLKEKKEKLELYKKGVMQQIFSQKLRFKDEKENEFPEWEEKRLGEVIIKNSKKNKNNEHKNVESISNKLGFVNQQEYFEDRRIASKDTKNYYVINKGDFAYNPSRIDVGSLAYKFDDKISIISPLYISFSTRKEFLVDAFLLNWLNSNSFQHQMDNSFEGGVRNTLSYDNLSKIKIIHPKSLLEQQKIANFSSALDTKINLITTQIEKTELWKKGLLQQMFV